MCGAPPCPGLGPCGIGQLHPVHPCFIAQLLCAVLLRSHDCNRLRTPGKHHLIIHHHLCRESQIPAADLSKNSSNKYQGDFGSYRQRTLPRRLCGQDSPSSALRELHYESPGLVLAACHFHAASKKSFPKSFLRDSLAQTCWMKRGVMGVQCSCL